LKHLRIKLKKSVNPSLNTIFVLGLLFLAHYAQASQPEGPVKCTLIADVTTKAILHKSGECDRRYSPCSSFKLPLALMGFDSGILESPQAPVWELKPEYKASSREQAFKQVDPALWESQSIVWYSQQLTTRLGEQRFAEYVKKFSYGNQDISGDPGQRNGLTRSWLMSSLTISPHEQIHFLQRFMARELPVSARAYEMTHASIPVYSAADGWTVHGKSGSGWLRDQKGNVDEARPQGWFVGWAEKGGRQVVFARLEVRAGRSDIYGGTKAKEDFLKEISGLVRFP